MATYWSPGSKAFQLSCMVHGIFFACLIAAAFWPPVEKKDKQHVFTLVSSHIPASQQHDPFPSIKSPEVAQATVSKHEIPKPPKVEQPPAPKSESKPTPASSSKKLVSYDDFIKKHGAPKANIPKPEKSVPTPRISSQGFSSELKQVLVQEGTGGWSSSNSNELSDYLAQLKDKLDAVWVKPQSLAKLTHLSTQVEFTIEPNGLLNGVRVVAPSGQVLFDDSVKRAFTQLHAAGRPPEGKRYSLRLTFRMEG